MALTPLQVASALAEISYRRAEEDQALDISSVGGSDFSVGDLSAQGLILNGGYYYDDSTGFVGRVVNVGGTIYVVCRGTDLGSVWSGGDQPRMMELADGVRFELTIELPRCRFSRPVP